MARSKLNTIASDLNSDSGNVLWSFVKGEQLEFPVVLNFIDDATAYEYEAVLIEADNIEGQTMKPTFVKTGGIQDVLTVRLPNIVGDWNPAQLYSRGDIVLYDGIYYVMGNALVRISSDTPDTDAMWTATAINIINVQFTAGLGGDWEVPPTVGAAVYGFFEIRVSELASGYFQKTWKPVRGMVELVFSPTDVVA